MGFLQYQKHSGETEQAKKDLYVRISLLDSNGATVEIPEGTAITINETSASTYGNAVYAKLYSGLENEEQSDELDIIINMDGVLPENLLSVGDYTIKIEYVLAQNEVLENIAEAETNITLKLINYDETGYGISVDIDTDTNINVQLSDEDSGETKSATLTYKVDTLDGGAYIKIRRTKKTAAFTYDETTNAKLISVSIGGTSITEDGSFPLSSSGTSENIVFTFNSGLDTGTYRIYFDLYDQYGTYLGEDFIGFIVK